MAERSKLPSDLAARAERRTWFQRHDAARVLDWMEETGQRFLGMDVAEKQEGGHWKLILENLDLCRQTENFEAVRRGRVFLAENDGEGRIFEPVWQDRTS